MCKLDYKPFYLFCAVCVSFIFNIHYAFTFRCKLDVFLQADKRAHHNALERKRRDHIKDSFHGLRDSVPSLQGEKTSSTRQTPVIGRNTWMILQSWVESEMDKKLSTGSWWTALWHGVETIISSGT
ncbi:hypothetical protein XENORESO_019695 [Xenotaenia resolanae]|uniref:Protein max n=1 Tax=Xenotaenia resolanae TaxID=208358 RepID=A0ABV0X6I3_9TELE